MVRFFAYFLVASQESQSPVGANSRPVEARSQPQANTSHPAEFQTMTPAQRTRYSAPSETPCSVCPSLVSRRAQSVDGGAVRPCMSERSEFAGPPADSVRSEGTPKER